jgi:glycosyltransferase involved in cell wall biosynthesis
LNIFLFVDSYLPSTKSCAKLIHDLANRFSDLDNNVTIITLSEEINEKIQIEVVNNIKIIRIKTGKISASTNKLSRAINEMSISYKVWRYGKEYFLNNKSDLLIWYSPTIFFGKAINKIKKLNNAKTYLILRDIFPQWALDFGILKKGIIYYYFKMMELYQYKQADVIGVQSPSDLEYFKKNNLYQKYKIEILYNWTQVQNEVLIKSTYRKKFNLTHKVVFFYGGNMGIGQDIDNILRLAKNLIKQPTAHFLLVGGGNDFERIKQLIKSEKLLNVTLKKAVEQKEYLSMLSEFDIGLISLNKNFTTSNFPGKMLGYMEFSMPMLISLNKGTDLEILIKKTNSGLTSINGDDETFKNNALLLIQNSNLREKMSLNSKNLLFDKFTTEIASTKILSHQKI